MAAARRAPAEPEPTEPTVPAWRHDHGATAVAMPVEVIRAVADPNELRVAAGDTERVARLRASLGNFGPHVPLTINVDGRGRIVLEDGNHRLLAAELAGLDCLPVRIKVVDAIRGYSSPVAPVLPSMVRGADPG